MNANTSNYNRNTHSVSSKSQQANKFYMFPLIFITSILPFIMRYHKYDAGLSSFPWFSDDGQYEDFFLYYKQVYFLIICSIMLLIIVYKIYKDKKSIGFKTILIPILLYGLLALLSTLFSKYPSFGFKGIYEQFESIFAILGYCLMIFYALLFIKTEEDIQLVFRFLLISVLVMGLLGLSQAIGHDLIGTRMAKKLILPLEFVDTLDFDFKFGAGRVYLTLYNPNYVGVYASLLIPLFTGFLFTEKNIKKILLYILALVGLLISLIGSESKTSFISLFIAAIFFIILFRKCIFRKNKTMLISVGVIGLAIIVIAALNISTITNTINTIFNITKSDPALTNIKTDEDLTITYKGNDLVINALTDDTSFALSLTDKDNKDVDYTIDDETSTFIINDARFAGIQINPVLYNDLICIDVIIDGKDWCFTNQTGDNTYYYINNVGKFAKIINADSSFLFKGYEKYASGRGYIWSRTIPLLKNYILLGSGADTFTMIFPQQDYVSKYNYGFDGMLLTRPHNMYLQIAVQSGVLSLLAVLVFYGMYFISSIKLYIKGNFNNYYSRAGVSIFIGTIAYMIAGITNDSTITVAPVFWVLIGIGIAINYKLKEIEKQNIAKADDK